MAEVGDSWRILILGTKWVLPHGPTVELIDRPTGRSIDYDIVDRATGERLRPRDLAVRPVR